jgi:HEPN domain-containing protein
MGGSSPSPEQIEVAGLLLRRAESELRACRLLAGDPEMEDDVVGFDAQQAIEKAITVALVLRGIDFPKTHDLDFLLARADGHGLEVPGEIEDAEWLTPWAAQLRYDEAAPPLDRDAAIGAAVGAVRWARSMVGP